ncbi:MAG: M23 family metallopeptidase [Myxococcaceae bacterium]
MIRRIVACGALGFFAALSGCGVGEADLIGPPGEDEGEMEESYLGVSQAAITCSPTMTVFPVKAPHNIGYDSASCGTGTCRASCPDQNANSDWGGSHHGIDVFAFQRAPMVAVADGTITRVGTPSSTSGLRVRLRDACGWEYYYGHMDQAVVSAGQRVTKGQLIGYMGRTGTGSTHLHFNVSPEGNYYSDINPITLLRNASASACVAPPPAPAPAPGCGMLVPGQSLSRGQAKGSCDGRFVLAMQTDGNLVLYQNGQALWHTHTYGTAASVVVMQGDGNLVLYDGSGRAYWSSGTYGHANAFTAIQNDGNLVVYSASHQALWSSHTCCR